MSTYFNGYIIENSGIRTISGGGTNASNASAALANLSGVSIIANQTISGIKTFANNVVVSGDLSLSLSNGNVSVPVGFSNFAYVRNLDSALSKGQSVYIAGAQGDRAAVRKASNTGEATSSKTFGIAVESIASGADGYVITNGQLQNLNTLTGFGAGDSVWLGTGNGSLTNIKPSAPNHAVFLGVVEKPGNTNDGIMYVKIQNGYELDELHDVLITSPQSGQVLFRDGDNLWKNKNLTSNDISGISYTLNFWHSSTSTSSNGNYYFNNILLVPNSSTGNRFLTVMENGVARRANWTQYATTTGSQILDSTGYFINITKQTSGIISTGIKSSLPAQTYNFTGEINPSVNVQVGDRVAIGWQVPAYSPTQPAGLNNSVDIYFYSK